jgi:hypothetical protein
MPCSSSSAESCFGARAQHDDIRTATGAGVGTPTYMAPESDEAADFCGIAGTLIT